MVISRHAKLLAALALAFVWPSSASAGSLSVITPLAASADVTVNVTGTGFAPTAADNTVTFTHVATGATTTAVPTAISVVSPTTDVRRVSVRLPQGILVGRTAVRVTNTLTGEISEGVSFEVIEIGLPEVTSGPLGSQNLRVRVQASPNTQFVNGARAAFGAGITVVSTAFISATTLEATINISATATPGVRNVAAISTNHQAIATGAFTVTVNQPPNRAPSAEIQGPTETFVGDQVTFSAIASDPDGDPLSFAWNFGDGATGTGASVTHIFAAEGVFTVRLTVSDGNGGTASASQAVTVTRRNQPPVITSTPVTTARIGQAYLYQVVANDPDGDPLAFALSRGPAGLSISPEGAVVWAPSESQVGPHEVGLEVSDGRGGLATQDFVVVVESPVTLTALELRPLQTTLRAENATAQLGLLGRYSDGSTRDLTADPATTYASNDETAVTVGATGLVTAVAEGEATITANHGGLFATAAVRVVFGTATGFVRGQVLDDSRSRLLAGATITLLEDGTGPLPTPATTVADARGRFVLPGAAGDVLVRVEKPGFTSVDRRGRIEPDTATSLLDARLTPIDPRLNEILSAFGGDARNADQTMSLTLPPGAIAVNTTIRLTSISGQGLAGRLPYGWSPAAVADIFPSPMTFAQPATLRLPNTVGLPAGAEVVLARYDRLQGAWVAQAPGVVSNDGRTIVAAIDQAGQFAAAVPDPAPFTPTPPATGAELAGVEPVALPEDVAASGEVTPRSVTPGDDVWAPGQVVLDPDAPLPSGLAVQARVTERFDLIDNSAVVPLPFTQDFITYARPRLGGPDSLAARFVVAPSLNFGLLDLLQGQVRLAVSAPGAGEGGAVVGTGGGSVTDEAGNRLDVPAGALADDTPIELRPIVPASVNVPEGFTLAGGVRVDLVGALFGQPAVLSIVRPVSLDANALVVVAQTFVDPLGGQRLRIIAIGDVTASRVATGRTLGALTLPGVTGGGDFLFLVPTAPLGFVAGTVFQPGGGTPQPGALVTSDATALADLTGADGRYVVAGIVGIEARVTALDFAGGASATGVATVVAVAGVAPLDLTLAAIAPSVISTSPAADARNVPLDTSIVIDFSEPIDPLTVTDATIVLSAAGQPIAAQRLVSADRRRVTLRPDSALAGLTLHTLAIDDGLRSPLGRAVLPFAPINFTTFDPSKPPQPAAGLITAQLPDEDGFVLIFGTAGSAEPLTPVSGTNLRTQETVTVLALDDGSFRFRLTAIAGDDLALILRGEDGREVTFTIAQLDGEDGTSAIGLRGGVIRGANGRVGRIIPRSLTAPGLFRIDDADVAAGTWPVLPSTLSHADRFVLHADGAAFNQVGSFSLAFSNSTIAPSQVGESPFAAERQVTVAFNFLVSATLRATASVTDVSGLRRSIEGAITVVEASPDTTRIVAGNDLEFPSVFVDVPRQALPNQQVTVRGDAPAARVDFELPVAAAPAPTTTVLVGRVIDVNGEAHLSVVDRLEPVSRDGQVFLRTVGREFPGTTTGGAFSAVASSGPLVNLTGRVSGPAAVVTADGWPLAAETGRPNGAFILPVPADEAFSLRFSDASTGALLGTVSGVAGPSGRQDLGFPLGSPEATLTVTANLTGATGVDISRPLVFSFSEPIDPQTLAGEGLVVTDQLGNRIFGRVSLSGGGTTATFEPLRRWRFGTRYRFGVSTTVAAVSGARLPVAFTGEFTAFAPRVMANLAVGAARDVALGTDVALLATADGFSVVDVARPDQPQVVAQAPIAGGARGVRFTDEGVVRDRENALVAGQVGVVSSGGGSEAGRLESWTVSGSAAPVRIGSTQVTTPAGQTPPAGVPNVAGTPGAVGVAGGEALVALAGGGVQQVTLGEAIPLDAANPARGLDGRYPAEPAESIVEAAVLDERVVVAGGNGLSVLDRTSFARTGNVGPFGDARALAVVPRFDMDRDGDGVIHPDREIFDLAVLATSGEATVQLFDVTDPTRPERFSVIRLPGDATGVVVDTADRLAYVGIGSRGIAVVDLTGIAAISPIDLDRNGLDDRVLGIVDTPGLAGRLAFDAGLGIGYVADGSSGLTAVQLRPARTVLETIRRDPVRGFAGDEQSMATSRSAFVSDEAILVRVLAAIPPGVDLALVIQEEPDAGSPRLLSFADGTTSTRLVTGRNDLELLLDRAAVSTGSAVTLRIQTLAGQLVDSFDFRLVAPDLSTSTVDSLGIVPFVVDLSSSVRAQQLSVSARMRDGRVINVTSPASGTTYFSANERIARVSETGLVTAVAGGTTEILVRNGTVFGAARVTVDAPAALETLEVRQNNYTLTGSGELLGLRLAAQFTNGEASVDFAALGITFESSDTSVVTVDDSGRLLAVGNGLATVTVRAGDLVEVVQVAVELRTTPDLTALTLDPVPDPVPSVPGVVDVTARVTGTGSLEGLTVAIGVPGARTYPAVTDFDGIARVRVMRLVAGATTLRAAVVNPTGGATLEATTALVVEEAGVDAEPNDTVATATPAALDAPVRGTLGSGDSRDVFRLDVPLAGAVVSTVQLGPTTSPADVRVLFLDAGGNELQRVTPTSRVERVTQPVAAGPAFLGIEAANGASVEYEVSSRLDQGPVSITAVQPASGGPGTAVAIEGSGFGDDVERVRVLFGGVPGRVAAVTPSRVDAIVPAEGRDGQLVVIVTARRGEGPTFVVGNDTPLPPPTFAPVAAAAARFDPASGGEVAVDRWTVHFEPGVEASEIEALAASVGATIVGRNVVLQTAEFQFAANRTLAGYHALGRDLRNRPGVRYLSAVSTVDLRDFSIDIVDRGSNWISGGAVATYLSQARVIDAIRAIRSTPGFVDDPNAFKVVRIGVIDTGFNPVNRGDFQVNGVDLVQAFRPNATTGAFEAGFSDAHGHGTKVISVIAGLNNGGTFSGTFGSLFKPNEANFQLLSYANQSSDGKSWGNANLAALTVLAAANIDILNASWGREYPSATQAFLDYRQSLVDAFALFGGKTTIFVAAGNEGIDSSFSLPDSLAGSLPYVMSIAGVGVLNSDGTGELADRRAVFGNNIADNLAHLACDPITKLDGSACGPTVTLAAPGEDIYVALSVEKSTGGVAYTRSRGTSYSSPMMAGIAAILQAIRPNAAAIAPDQLRALLLDTADDITSTWDPGPMRRVNALAAVRALLPPSDTQTIYVADQDAGGTGSLVAMEIDPLTGLKLAPASDRVIPLETSVGLLAVSGIRPTGIAISPVGDRAYVVVSTTGGRGLMRINTSSQRAEGFLPLPAAPSAPRPGMAFSRDGRLLYVATGLGITIVNTASNAVVQSFADLPVEYRALASTTQGASLADRLNALQGIATAGVNGRAGTQISSLALSPDGRRLYAAVSTGGGGGMQPGFVMPIDVDLYTDGAPGVPGLQSDLTRYMNPAFDGVPTLAMARPGQFPGGDEPASVAVSADGKYIYLVNGGVNFFQAIPPGDLEIGTYLMIFGASAVGATATASLGLPGLLTSVGILSLGASALYTQMAQDIRLQAESGQTLLSAPSMTGVFSVDGATPAQTWFFPSNVVFGWNPPATSGGLVVNQFRFPSVFAKRPFAMTVRHDGRRALMALFQTGNFAILDLDAQQAFQTVSSPNTSLGGLPDDMFHGVVGVTRALPLDNHLWPSAGVIRQGLNNLVPSRDEALLYPQEIVYAQNGRFAVATHVGTSRPSEVTITLPDWTQSDRTFASLTLRGWQISQSSTSGEDENGNPVSVGGSYTFKKSGGAVTIIDDQAITADLEAKIDLPIFSSGTTRPYYSTIPVCRQASIISSQVNTCAQPVVTHYYEHRAGGTPTDFIRPRGVAVQPFVYIESPRFGDHVTRGTAIHVGWRDARIRKLVVSVYDRSTPDQNGDPTLVYEEPVQLDAQTIQRRTTTAQFGALFYPEAQPVQGHRYRVVIQAYVDVPANERLSIVDLDVVFDDTAAQPNFNQLELTPLANFFIEAPSQAQDAKQLKVVLKRVDGSEVDVTTSPDTTITWLGNGLLPGEVEDLNEILAEIRTKLAEDGVPVPFDIGEISVDASRMLHAVSPGLQVIRATHPDAVGSSFAVVFMGLQLDKIAIEPESPLTTGINTLMDLVKEGENNAPLLLTTFDAAWFASVGYVRLVDVKFKFLGQGSLAVEDLEKALDALLKKAKVVGTKAKILKKIVTLATSVTATEFLLDLESGNTDIASVGCPGVIDVDGCVKGLNPGVTEVTGTLDLNEFTVLGQTYRVGLGKKSDSVVTLVLPELDTVEVKPHKTVINRADPPVPGPTIRSLAKLRVFDDATLELPDSFADVTEFAEAVLPEFMRTATAEGTTFSITENLDLFVRGTVALEGNGIAVRGFQFGFTVPTNVPGITNGYLVRDASLADAVTSTLGGPIRFRTHLRHKNRVGRSFIDNTVQIVGLGQAPGLGQVEICDCATGFLVKSISDQSLVFEPGSTVTFTIELANPRQQEVLDVVLVDTTTFYPGSQSAPTGPPQETTTQTFLGTFAPNESRTVTIAYTMPNQVGEVVNVASAAGFIESRVSVPTGGPVISEMVLRPQRDWNDSSGGNGVPFDDMPGNGTVDNADIWVEITSPTTPTENWQVVLVDDTGAEFSQVLGPPIIFPSDPTRAPVRVLSNFGVGAAPIVRVEVRDQNGLVRQTLDILAIEAALGPATGPDNESLTWSIYGSPTLPTQQFVRRRATIGVFNPF